MSRDLIAKALGIPFFYNTFLNAIGAESGVVQLVNNYLRPEAGMRIIDIGCGTGRMLDYFPQGITYTGYDLDEKYISYAKQKYPERASFFAMRVSEITADEPDSYDLICAVAILHHIDDQEATHLFSIAHTLLKPGGRIVTCDCAVLEKQNPIARLAIKLDRGQHVRSPEAYISLASQKFSDVKDFLRHDLLKIPYTHYFMECTK